MLKGNLKRKLSLVLAGIFIMSTVSFLPSNKTVKAQGSFTYKVDSSNFEKPQAHPEQSILADEYDAMPGHQPVPGYGEEVGWKFKQTVLFSQVDAESDSNMDTYYDGADSIKTEMARANYWIDKTDVTGDDYYDNWRFENMRSKSMTYDYGALTYYQDVKILDDVCRIAYKIDTNTFKRASDGAVMFLPYSKARDKSLGNVFVHDYHIATVTSNPQHTSPTADFYLSGTSFKAGDTIDAIDGKKDGYFIDKDTNTPDKYWMTYFKDGSQDAVKHGDAGKNFQSYTYDNAVIKASSWSITDSKGNNVNALFSPNLNNANNSNYMKLTVGNNVPEGTYTIHHSVLDNWDTKSGDQTKTFTVSNDKPTPQPEPTSTSKGKIIFNPNDQIPWSNEGKPDGFKVNVSCESPNVTEKWVQKYNVHAVTTTQVPTGTDKDGNTTYTTQTSTSDTEQDVQFNVYYKIGTISVSGNCTPSSVESGGNVLVQEGFQSKLHGTAAYHIDHKDTPVAPSPSNTSNTTYTVTQGQIVKPSGCIEADPNIEGDSGIYDIDYTDPIVDFSVTPGIFSGSGVTRQASTTGQGDGLYGTLNYSDNLSGVNMVQYHWTFGSDDVGTYTTVYTSPVTYTNRSDERLSSLIEKPVGDNLYLHVKVVDTAGNETTQTFGPYEDPIKLKSFRVTDVRDPNWDKVFWTDDTFTQKTGNYYDAPRLPIDWNSNPLHPSASSDHPVGAPKKGYAFYYQLTSEYLYRLNDQVIIKPTFYWTDGTSMRIPVDLYYTTGVNTLVKAGSTADKQQFNMKLKDITQQLDKKIIIANNFDDIDKQKDSDKILIGGLLQEILFDSVRVHQYNVPYSDWKGNIQYQYGKEQTWYGKYFIPATSRVYKQGQPVKPENELKKGYIIINFQLTGKKNGVETNSSDQTFTYVPDQWKAEGGPKQFGSYQAGDVMVHDNEYSVLDDYDSKGTQ